MPADSPSRPGRRCARAVLTLLRDGRTRPDDWSRRERAAVTRLHSWAFREGGLPSWPLPVPAPAAARVRVDEDEQGLRLSGQFVVEDGAGAIRTGGRPTPLPSEVLGSLDSGRGIAGWILAPDDLDRLRVLSRDPGDGNDDLLSERDAVHGYPALDRRLGLAHGLPPGVEDEHYCPTCHQRTAIPVDDPPDGYEANLDALRAEVARLNGFLDDASREADRADAAEAELATYRREVDEQTGRAEREHALRLRAEQMLAEQRRATETLRGHLDAERARAERAEGLVDDPADLRPVDDDPRRPHPDSWPDDAVLLRYVELRRLVALHLERYGVNTEVVRAMREADVPLRVSEVLA